MMQLNACTSWAIAPGMIDIPQSPFSGLAAEVRKTVRLAKPAFDINPFSSDERDLIISAFRGNHYIHYVRFCFFHRMQTKRGDRVDVGRYSF